jgi:SAM-dependent methyltransferase
VATTDRRPVPGDTAKFSWLLKHLQCPACGSTVSPSGQHAVTCDGCHSRFPVVDETVNFIDDDAIASFALVDTENVSDHPYDENAMVIIDRCQAIEGMVLDCGSGYKSETFPNVIQMEIARYPYVDVLGVNQRIPFQDASFDAVFTLDVLEHVNDPFTSAVEIARVLKPGGTLYFDMPFLVAEHGYPHHYFNATRMGVRRLFDSLECLSHHVPESGEPMFAIHQMLSLFRGGLPAEERTRFEQMTVAEIVDKSPDEWKYDALTGRLSDRVRWEIPATTQALFRKPAGSTGTQLVVAPEDLPAFVRVAERSSRVYAPPPAPTTPPPAPIRQGRWTRARRVFRDAGFLGLLKVVVARVTGRG